MRVMLKVGVFLKIVVVVLLHFNGDFEKVP